MGGVSLRGQPPAGTVAGARWHGMGEVALWFRVGRESTRIRAEWTHWPQGVRTTYRSVWARVPVTSDDLHGLSLHAQALALLDAWSIDVADREARQRVSAPEPPEGGYGGESVSPAGC